MKRVLILWIFLCSLSVINAAEFILKELSFDKNSSEQWIVLPYAFSSDTTGLTGGAAGIFHGFLQPQMTVVASAFIGEKIDVQKVNALDGEQARTQGAFLAVTGFRIPYTERFFLSFMGMNSYYPNQRLYLNGANDSQQNLEPTDPLSATTPLQTQGWNNWANLDLRYVLPLGESKNKALPVIEMMRGMPVNRQGIGGGLPFVTGQTIIGVKPFYQLWSAEKFNPEAQIATNGVKLYIDHDNTDYPDNPSRGYSFHIEYTQDFGLGESTQAWNSIEASYSHYFELPDLQYTRQNVLALDFWSAYSPSWDKNTDYTRPDGSTSSNFDKGQTPMWEGARLGGFNRLRAYDSNRFNDKAALYGAIEYRIIPQFNPMKDQEWSPIPIMWWQTVLFAEVGRVAPKYSAELLNDMKYDVGFSIRALAASVPVRFEMAWGEEGSSMWVMLKQPF